MTSSKTLLTSSNFQELGDLPPFFQSHSNLESVQLNDHHLQLNENSQQTTKNSFVSTPQAQQINDKTTFNCNSMSASSSRGSSIRPSSRNNLNANNLTSDDHTLSDRDDYNPNKSKLSRNTHDGKYIAQNQIIQDNYQPHFLKNGQAVKGNNEFIMSEMGNQRVTQGVSHNFTHNMTLNQQMNSKSVGESNNTNGLLDRAVSPMYEVNDPLNNFGLNDVDYEFSKNSYSNNVQQLNANLSHSSPQLITTSVMFEPGTYSLPASVTNSGTNTPNIRPVSCQQIWNGENPTQMLQQNYIRDEIYQNRAHHISDFHQSIPVSNIPQSQPLPQFSRQIRAHHSFSMPHQQQEQQYKVPNRFQTHDRTQNLFQYHQFQNESQQYQNKSSKGQVRYPTHDRQIQSVPVSLMNSPFHSSPQTPACLTPPMTPKVSTANYQPSDLQNAFDFNARMKNLNLSDNDYSSQLSLGNQVNEYHQQEHNQFKSLNDNIKSNQRFSIDQQYFPQQNVQSHQMYRSGTQSPAIPFQPQRNSEMYGNSHQLPFDHDLQGNLNSSFSSNQLKAENGNQLNDSHFSILIEPRNSSPNQFENVPARNLFVYQVRFKHNYSNFIASPTIRKVISIDDFVKVEADRGEDLGKVMKIMTIKEFNDKMSSQAANTRNPLSTVESLKRIINFASLSEISSLQTKALEEEQVLKACRAKVHTRNLPMTVIDAEYQYDRNKLTFYFEAECRVDFRELVKDLHSIYKNRIWLQQISSKVYANGRLTSVQEMHTLPGTPSNEFDMISSGTMSNTPMESEIPIRLSASRTNSSEFDMSSNGSVNNFYSNQLRNQSQQIPSYFH